MSDRRIVPIPEVSSVVLVGASATGRSAFDRAHFWPPEVVSSDPVCGMVFDDEKVQGATAAAVDLLRTILANWLASEAADRSRGHERAARRPRTVGRAGEGVAPRAGRDRSRPAGKNPRGQQSGQDDHGPYDIVGDVHGCFSEVLELLARLGYSVTTDSGEAGPRCRVRHPDKRRLVFLGDLVDRGPRIPETLRLAMDAVSDGVALCVPGNHDDKLLRALWGRNVRITHGLDESLRQLKGESPEFRERVVAFFEGLVSYYVLDDGKLIVAHAGLKESLQGRSSGAVRDFVLYGETTGKTGADGLPVRVDWARSYRGAATVVYGHTPVATPQWINNTINIDTGCVFGGRLTALRWPERDLVSVPAERTYAVPARPFLT